MTQARSVQGRSEDRSCTGGLVYTPVIYMHKASRQKEKEKEKTDTVRRSDVPVPVAVLAVGHTARAVEGFDPLTQGVQAQAGAAAEAVLLLRVGG